MEEFVIVFIYFSIQFQYELSNDLDRDHLKISDNRHVDHENPHTFEIEDLKKLIHKTSEDLAEADKKRREEFKVCGQFYFNKTIFKQTNKTKFHPKFEILFR